MVTKTPTHALYYARRKACLAWPKASKAILSLTPVLRRGLGTMAVDKHWRIYYDDAWLAKQPEAQGVATVLHEISHLLLKHYLRGERLPKHLWKLWNIATDAAINGMLRADGHLVPPDSVFAEKLGLPDLMSAEFYFAELRRQMEQQEQEKRKQGASNAEEESDESGEEEIGDDNEGDGSSDGADGTEDGVPGEESFSDGEGTSTSESDGVSRDVPTSVSGDSDSQSSSAPQGGNSQGTVDADGNYTGPPVEPGSSGSCADGQQRPWELGEPSDEHPGMDEYDQDQVVKEFAKSVAKGKGDGAGSSWLRWANEVLRPKRDILAPIRAMVRKTCETTSGIGDRSYRRPSRRSNPDVILPINVCPIPRITVIVDTSGSMDQDDISLALGAVRSVLDGFRIRDGITFISGDTRAQTVQKKLGNIKRCQFKGGGGTSMVAPIKFAVEQKPKPQLLIVCTDGQLYASDWGQKPDVPVLGVITSHQSGLFKVPSWVKSVNIARDSSEY